MLIKKFFSIFLLCSFVLAGCAEKEDGDSSSEMSYDQTKKMVMDILETEDGKKTIADIMSTKDMQQMLVLNQNTVATTIEETLTSDKGKKFWEESFKDPDFVTSYAKGMKSEHIKLLKSLMKDPTYQKDLIDVMKNEELEKEVLQLLKSQKYRKYLQTVIAESFETPTFEAKMLEYVKKSTSEMTEPEKKEE